VISNDSSLVEGETALLACVGYGQPDVEITWVRDGETVMNSTLITIYEEDIVQGERLFKQSFLQLCSVDLVHSGGYTCVASNGERSVNSTVQLTVTGKHIYTLLDSSFTVVIYSC